MTKTTEAALLEMYKNQKQDEVPTVEGAANLMNAKFFDEKKYEEIAHELQISVNTVKYHIKHALTLLHEDLGKYL